MLTSYPREYSPVCVHILFCTCKSKCKIFTWTGGYLFPLSIFIQEATQFFFNITNSCSEEYYPVCKIKSVYKVRGGPDVTKSWVWHKWHSSFLVGLHLLFIVVLTNLLLFSQSISSVLAEFVHLLPGKTLVLPAILTQGNKNKQCYHCQVISNGGTREVFPSQRSEPGSSVLRCVWGFIKTINNNCHLIFYNNFQYWMILYI